MNPDKTEPPIANCNTASDCCSGRTSARDVILEEARRLHNEAHDLERLADALPTVMNPSADMALWKLVLKS